MCAHIFTFLDHIKCQFDPIGIEVVVDHVQVVLGQKVTDHSVQPSSTRRARAIRARPLHARRVMVGLVVREAVRAILTGYVVPEATLVLHGLLHL
jgi:hypothetical protein